MSGSSSIEWCDATWNPTRGCSRVSEGCRNCFAERIAARFVKPGQPFHGFAKVTAPRDDLDRVGGRRNGWTGKVELVPSALDWPLRWRGDKRARAAGRPSRIFVNSMSDLFHERLSDEEIAAVFGVMAACPQHTFQVLTKRPERARKWFEWVSDEEDGIGVNRILSAAAHELGDGSESDCTRQYDRICELAGCVANPPRWPLANVWLGCSVEDQATADERIPLLLQCQAAVRFVSYEPALGAVDFRFLQPKDPPVEIDALAGTHGVLRPHGGTNARLDWLIVGGESGPGARPFDLAWARAVVEQCREAGVACFVKQLGARAMQHDPAHEWFDGKDFHTGGRALLNLRDRKGGDWSEWPEDLRVREFPR